MKCPKCSNETAVRDGDLFTACSSCQFLTVHAHPLPAPRKVSEKTSDGSVVITIDSRNPILAGLLLFTILLAGGCFIFALSHDHELNRMGAQFRELIREESFIFLLPMLTGLMMPLAALYMAVNLAVNRKTLTLVESRLVRSAFPLPPLFGAGRIPLDNVNKLKVEGVKNSSAWSLQAVMETGRKLTVWPADTEPLLVLYLEQRIGEYLEALKLQQGSPLVQGFSKALDAGDCDRILTMLDSHPELANQRSIGGRTPLTVASSEGHMALARMLLGAGADVTMADRGQYRTALHYACLKGTMDMVTLLLEHNAEVNRTDREGATPLHLARAAHQADIIQALTRRGAKDSIIYTEQKQGFPLAMLAPLLFPIAVFMIMFAINLGNAHMAANRGDLNKVKSLIEANPALLNEQSPKLSETLLHEAAGTGRLEVVKYLTEKGADLTLRDGYGRTALEKAINRKQNEVARYLLEQAAAGKARQVNRPLHEAADSGNMEIVKLLADRGYDVNETDKFGLTPLHYATRNDSFEIAKMLIEKGADVNASQAGRDCNGKAPLHYARSDRMVRILVKKGAHVDARDLKGATPLHYAAEGFGSAVEELLAQGADVNAKDNAGRTPLSYARSHRYSSKVLTEHGGKE